MNKPYSAAVILALLFATLLAAADEDSDAGKTQRLLDACKAGQDAAVSNQQRKVDRLKKEFTALQKQPVSRADREAFRERLQVVAKLKADMQSESDTLASLKKPERAIDFVPYLMNERPTVGKIGRFRPNETIRVQQIINGNEMIVEASWKRPVEKVSRGSQGSIAVGTVMEPVPMSLLVKGVSTEAWSDDSEINLRQVFEVTKNQQYATAIGGTNTVLVIEPFDTQHIEKLLAK